MNKTIIKTRRNFLKQFGVILITPPIGSIIRPHRESVSKLTFGVCADLHGDIMHDTAERLDKFIARMNKEKVDFIIQLGDFFKPIQHNETWLKAWNQFQGYRFHVIGNHEMDGGISKNQVIDFFKIPNRYYSFSCGSTTFIVLDGNNHNPSGNAGYYPRYIDKDQLNWLEKKITRANNNIIIFSHQSLINTHDGIENQEEVRQLLESIHPNKRKVIAAFCGHSHMDRTFVHNDIYYIHINSMSHLPLGEPYQHIRYSEQVDSEYPVLKLTAPYAEPLYALCTITNKEIQLSGRKTTYVGPSPSELGALLPDHYRPQISTQTLKLH